MAASLEILVLSKIVDTQDFHTAEKCKITEDFFAEDTCKQLFLWLKGHYHNPATYGQIPGRQITSSWFPSFTFITCPDALATLCEQLRIEKMRGQVQELAMQLQMQANADPRECLALLRDATSILAAQHELSNDLLLSDSYEILRSEYDLVASNQGITGIPFPWQVLNDEVQGMHPGNFIVIYGRPKNMKTWVALDIGVYAYLHASQRVLIVSMEMPAPDIQRRCASVLGSVDYNKLRKGKLQPADRDRLFQMLMFLKDQERHFANSPTHFPSILATSGIGSRGVSAVHAKIRDFKPDLVIVDGLYRMADDRQKARSLDWKNVAHITQDLKETAIQFGIPVIGVTQASKAGAKMKPSELDAIDLAYTDALGQECDMLIKVKKMIDEQTKLPELLLSFPAIREGVLDYFVIHGVPGINFGYKRAYTAPDPNAQNSGNGGGGGAGNGGSRGSIPAPPPPQFTGISHTLRGPTA